MNAVERGPSWGPSRRAARKLVGYRDPFQLMGKKLVTKLTYLKYNISFLEPEPIVFHLRLAPSPFINTFTSEMAVRSFRTS